MTDAPDTVFCSIAIPAEPITKSSVTSFQLRGNRVGLWLAVGLLVLLGVVFILVHRRFAFSTLTVFALLLCVIYLIARYHRLTLYSVIVHTSDPAASSISFYRTFEAFDFALVLDWLTSSVGDHPRICTGAMRHHQDRDP
ncbi:MAG: hypothetical protein JNJ83_12930 [Verrucomicrobiaceae bacterium]|nr:hypothetical protein [Verrucomicrobiaceae bacterium]